MDMTFLCYRCNVMKTTKNVFELEKPHMRNSKMYFLFHLFSVYVSLSLSFSLCHSLSLCVTGLTAATLAEAMKKKIKLEVLNSYHAANNHGADHENGDVNSGMGESPRTFPDTSTNFIFICVNIPQVLFLSIN